MPKKLLMNNYSENGLLPVMDGLICWLDGRDGKGTDSVWVDRSDNNFNVALKGYNFPKDKWTGSSFLMNYTSNSRMEPPFSQYEIGSVEIYCRIVEATEDAWNVVLGTELIFVKPKGFDSILSTKYGWIESSSKLIETDVNLHVCITFSINSLKVYRQGKLVYETNGNYAPRPASCDYLFQRIGLPKQTFSGYVHSLKIYDRALSEEEIQQNYLYEQSIERG